MSGGYSFGDRTRRCLTSAGWSSDRRVDISGFVRVLESEGYEVTDSVRRFFASFALLVLSYPNFRDATIPDHCHFDATIGAANVFPEQVRCWSELTGQNLCPIGEAFDDHMTLVMTPSGAVYAGYDDILTYVAPSGEEALDVLCEGRDLKDVALPAE